MTSTLTRTAAPAPTAPTVVDAVVLPAAVAAPSALVIAVESWLAQETSALRGPAGTGVVGLAPAAHAAPASAYASACVHGTSRVLRNDDVQGSPPRGAPV